MIITDQKILRTVSTEVSFEKGLETVKLLLTEIPDASGLAAIQIGLSDRVFITKFKEEYLEWINPKIEEHEKETIISEEGCLSIPNKKVKVERYKQITVSTQASEKDRKEYVLLDEEAVIFQHELDHLNGILIIDKVYEKIGRNDKCKCGSGLKFKKCCGN